MGKSIDGLVEVISRRTGLIDLLEGEKFRRGRLNSETEVSRPTVYRALKELQNHEIVSQRDGKYGATEYGHMAHRSFQDFISKLEALGELHSVTGTLPQADAFDPAVLVNAEITSAQRDGPDSPLRQFQALLEDASKARISMPIDSVRLRELLQYRLERGLAIELLLDASNLEIETDDLLSHERCTWTNQSKLPPFLFLVVDHPKTEVGVIIFDDIGRPEASIRNDTDEAIGWAEATYHTCIVDES